MKYFNLNESTLVIEDELKSILMNIGSPVSSWLLRLYNNSTDIDKLKKNNIGLVENSDDSISFIPDGRNTQQKSTIKIGRFIREIALLQGKIFLDTDIEKFVNQYKAAIKTKLDFRILKGSDIREGYNTYNYFDVNRGNLGNSCMNDCSEYLDIYVDSPDVCSLLCLYENNLIVGRAILWINKEGDKLMDRIYTMHDSDVEVFRNWSNSHGYYYKGMNNSGLQSRFRNSKGILDKQNIIKLSKKLSSYSNFPYLDTFCYGFDDYYLTNEEPDLGEVDLYYELRSTGGDYEVHSDEEQILDYNGNIIDKQDLDLYVNSNLEGGLILEEFAILLDYEYADIKVLDYAFKDNVFYSKLDNDYYLKKHLVWSDFENDYLFRGSAIYVKNDWVHESHLDDYNPNDREIINLSEKSKSKSQQRLFGWAYWAKRNPDTSVPYKIRKLSNSVKIKDLKEFAKTKHKGLPERKKK